MAWPSRFQVLEVLAHAAFGLVTGSIYVGIVS